jgi:hypothetical protein
VGPGIGTLCERGNTRGFWESLLLSNPWKLESAGGMKLSRQSKSRLFGGSLFMHMEKSSAPAGGGAPPHSSPAASLRRLCGFLCDLYEDPS